MQKNNFQPKNKKNFFNVTFLSSFSPYHEHIPGEYGVGDRLKKVKEFRGTDKKKEKDK